MNTNDICESIEGFPLAYSSTNELHYGKKTLEPYNSYMFTFNAVTNTKYGNAFSIVMIAESNIPLLIVKIPYTLIS